LDTPEIAALWRLLFSASHRLESAQGRGGTLFGAGADRPLPDPSIAELARALDAVPLSAADDASALAAFSWSVDSARYWQEPEGIDELLLGRDLRTALERVAAAVSDSQAIAWWTDPVGSEQWSVEFSDSAGRIAFERLPAAEALRNWSEQQAANELRAVRDRPAALDANFGGEWWSKPPSALVSSTRGISGLGPVGLWLVEDSLGWTTADVHRIRPSDRLRRYEITGADAWLRLCRSYPLDVTATRRHDWYRTTGRAGRWVIPDWSQVSRDYDAVHLTAAGYLSAAGVPIPIDDEFSSVIAGWNPDQTYWLNDVASDAGSRWSRDSDTAQWTWQG
jgi:hypothetical protein